MLYELLKPVMRIAVRVFYRVEIAGLDKLPRNKPVIVAPNHPNAFMDAIALAVHTPQQLHFLVRSDVFNTPLKRWFLHQLNQFPIYRALEGTENLHKNEETFKLCNRLLSQNKTLLIFPEGLCVQERRLRKLKKGAGRIVFGAEASAGFKMDLLVVPIGLNYENPKRFRSRLLIKFGEPMHVSDYIKAYQQEPVRTVNEFTRDLEDNMAKVLVIIEDKANDNLTADIEEIYKKDLITDKGLDPNNLQDDFRVTNDLVRAIGWFNRSQPERTMQMKLIISSYLEDVRKYRLRDHLLKRKFIEEMSIKKSTIEFFLLWIGMPLHLYGLLNYYLPWKLAGRIADKTAKHVEFHSSVNVAAGTFLSLIWSAILVIAVGLIFRNWYVLGAFIISIPLSGWFSLHFRSFIKKTFGKLRLLSLFKKDPGAVQRLVHTRIQIVDELERARKEYSLHVKAGEKTLDFSSN